MHQFEVTKGNEDPGKRKMSQRKTELSYGHCLFMCGFHSNNERTEPVSGTE